CRVCFWFGGRGKRTRQGGADRFRADRHFHADDVRQCERLVLWPSEGFHGARGLSYAARHLAALRAQEGLFLQEIRHVADAEFGVLLWWLRHSWHLLREVSGSARLPRLCQAGAAERAGPLQSRRQIRHGFDSDFDHRLSNLLTLRCEPKASLEGSYRCRLQ